MIAGIVATLVVLASGPAVAQRTAAGPTADPLQNICTGFLDQAGQGVSGDRAKLCECLVRETKARLTAQEMATYNKAGETGQPPPPAIMEKVLAIATTCLAAR